MRPLAARHTTTLPDLYAPIAAQLHESTRIFQNELTADEPVILGLFRHAEKYRGKQLRPALLLLAAQASGELRPEHPVLAAVVEMVHVATLVHDDILDEGQIRRFAVTANRLWGNPRAVLLGDLLVSHAYRLCSSLRSQEAAQVVAKTAIQVCSGETVQIANRGNLDLAEEEYFDIITGKTASLIGASTYLGAKYAGADQATCRRLRDFGTSLGVAFQITDDLLDLVGDESRAGKSLRRDADEGELTLPLIHFLREGSPDRCAELRSELRDPAGRRNGHIAALLETTGSIDYARQAVNTYIRDALRSVSALPDSAARRSLTAMAEYVATR